MLIAGLAENGARRDPRALPKWIEQRRPRSGKIVDVAGGDGEAMYQSRGGEQGVYGRTSPPGSLRLSADTSPSFRYLPVNGENGTGKGRKDIRLQPSLQRLSTGGILVGGNALSQLADGQDGNEQQIVLHGFHPCHDVRIGAFAGEFGENARVKQPLHSDTVLPMSRLREKSKSSLPPGQRRRASSGEGFFTNLSRYARHEITTTAGEPRFVTICGTSPLARATTSEKLFFASCNAQIGLMGTSKLASLARRTRY